MSEGPLSGRPLGGGPPPRARWGGAARVGLAVASGLLLHVAVGREEPSLVGGVLAIAALATSIRGTSLRAAAALGGLAGIVACGATFAFVARGVELAGRGPVLGIGLAAATALVHAARVALAATLGAALHRRGAPTGVTVALGWLAAETLDPAPFPWSLAAAAIDAPIATAAADLGGAALASLVVAGAGGLLADALARKVHRTWTPALALTLAALLLHGGLRVDTLRQTIDHEATRVVVAAVHGVRSIDVASRPPTAERAAAERAVAAGAQLVVLAEASLVLPSRQDAAEAARAAFGDLGVSTVVGVSAPRVAGRSSLNALVVLDETGAPILLQEKVRPFPIGEDDRFPWGLAGLHAPAGALAAGPEIGPPIVQVAGTRVRLQLSICWEDLFPAAAGPGSRTEGVILVAGVNDGWFEGTRAGGVHLLQSRLRAVEARAPLVRATNLGVSAVVDPFGAVRSETRGPEGDVLAEVPLLATRPLAARGGREATTALAIAIVVGAVWAALRRARAVPTPR